MKNKTMKILAMLLCVLTCSSIFTCAASAASYGSDYWNYTEPSGSDYAYWNGKKMVKHSGTNTSNVKWMQAAMNYCIDKGYITGGSCFANAFHFSPNGRGP
ncbi:MAG: hypothetical protein IJ766_04885 [Clostridia bacterium]|nr:hypothetical protein [Clostridia bacterium]